MKEDLCLCTLDGLNMEHAGQTPFARPKSHLSMASSSSLPVASSRLLVLYASQTGNAIDAAERVGREAERGGCPAVDVLSMDSFDPVSSEP